MNKLNDQTKTGKKLRIGLMGLSAKPMPEPIDAISPPGLVCSQLAEELSLRGHDVTIYSGADSQINSNPRLKLESNNLNSPWLEFGPESRNPISFTERRAEFDLILSQKIIEDYQQGKLDLIHSHDLRLNPYLFAQSKVPVIYTPHFDLSTRLTAYDQHRYKLMQSMQTGFIHISKQNIATSQNLKLKTYGYAPNGIKIEDYPFSNSVRSGVITVAVISKNKMIRQAIEGALLAGEQITIIGPVGSKDSEQSYYDQLIKDFKGNSQVKFTGMLKRSQIVPYYQQAKALIYPSQSEGMPLTILEAMATGLPVIASNVGGIKDIITDQIDGFLINDIDPTKIAAKIDQIKSINCQLTRKKIEQFFTINHMVNSYEQGYLRFLENMPYETASRPNFESIKSS